MKRMLCFLIAALLLVPYLAGVTSTATAEDNSIATTEDPLLEELEEKAVNYITKYINMTLLYSTEDFTEGTLLECLDEISSTSIQVDGKSRSVTELVSILRNFKEVATYYKIGRSYTGMQFIYLETAFSISDAAIDGNNAKVELFSLIAHASEGQQDLSYAGNNYTIYFTKLNGEWCICDIYSEEIKAYGLSAGRYDFDTSLRELLLDIHGNKKPIRNYFSDYRWMINATPILSRT